MNSLAGNLRPFDQEGFSEAVPAVLPQDSRQGPAYIKDAPEATELSSNAWVLLYQNNRLERLPQNAFVILTGGVQTLTTAQQAQVRGNLSLIPTSGKVIHVSKADTATDTRTGLDKYDPAKPFATLAAAKAAATAGDTIVVGPGGYDENNLLKADVNWFFLPGANVTFTGSGTGAIWDDSADGANGAVHSKIQGFGRFIYTGSGTSKHASKNVFYVTNAGSHIDVNCEDVFLRSQIDANLGAENGAVVVNDGYLKLNCHAIEATDTGLIFLSRAGVLWRGGDMDIRCERIHVTQANGQPYGVWGKGATSGTAWISAHHITSDHYAAIGTNDMTIGGVLHVRAMTARSNVSVATVLRVFGGTVIAHLDHIIAQGGAVSVNEVSSAVYLATRLATSTSGSNPIIFAADGTLSVDGGAYIATGTAKGAQLNSGTLRLNGVRLDTSANNAANPAVKSGGTLILGAGTVLIAEATRDSITATTAQDVKIYGTAVANKSIHANVTLKVGTLIVDTEVT